MQARVQMNRSDFAEMVFEYLKSNLGSSVDVCHDRHDNSISCYRDSKSMGTLVLDNIYHDYLEADPQEHGQMLNRWASYFTLDHELDSDFDYVTSRLLPSLRPNSAFASLFYSMGQEYFTVTQYSWDHSTVLCVDHQDFTTVPNNENIAAWGRTMEELNALAMRNLLGITQEAEFMMIAPGVYIGGWCDTYDSSRLMLTDLFGLLEMNGDPVAIIGSKETIFVTGAEDVNGLDDLLKFGLMACDKPRPLHGLPIILQNGRWERFDLPPAHPVHKQLVDYHREIGHRRMA